jgi:hypothetical protein
MRRGERWSEFLNGFKVWGVSPTKARLGDKKDSNPGSPYPDPNPKPDPKPDPSPRPYPYPKPLTQIPYVEGRCVGSDSDAFIYRWRLWSWRWEFRCFFSYFPPEIGQSSSFRIGVDIPPEIGRLPNLWEFHIYTPDHVVVHANCFPGDRWYALHGKTSYFPKHRWLALCKKD